jgi:hypothetical protein
MSLIAPPESTKLASAAQPDKQATTTLAENRFRKSEFCVRLNYSFFCFFFPSAVATLIRQAFRLTSGEGFTLPTKIGKGKFQETINATMKRTAKNITPAISAIVCLVSVVMREV